MNTIFTRKLEKIWNGMDIMYDTRFSGNILLGRLTDETIAKISLNTGEMKHCYDSVRMDVINI